MLQILKNHHPIAEELLEYRHLNKLVNTYIFRLNVLIMELIQTFLKD